MALTEFQRRVLIADLRQNITFTFEDVDYDVKIYRHGEGFDKRHPYVTVEFMPSSRRKFGSLGDYVGPATPAGQYHEYAWCQIEAVSIHVYCHVMHRSYQTHGRLLCDYIASTILEHILKYWEFLLPQMNASLDYMEDIAIRDVSFFEGIGKSATRVYNYDINLYLRTQFRWDDKPTDYSGEEDIVEKIDVLTLNDDRNQGPIESE